MLALSSAHSTRLATVASARSSRSKPVRVANVTVRASKSSEVSDLPFVCLDDLILIVLEAEGPYAPS